MILNLATANDIISIVSNDSGTVHIVTVRNRLTGRVTTEILYGQLPAWTARRV
jgi:hypothetical protein